MPDVYNLQKTSLRPFMCLWYEAYNQIIKEIHPENLDNDIKLFCILRDAVLCPEKPIYTKSYRINDFATPGIIRKTLNYPTGNSIYISWNHLPQQYTGPNRPYSIQNKNRPAKITSLCIDKTNIIEHNNLIKIQDDCIFEPTNAWTPKKILYTVIHEDFVTKLDKTRVLFPVAQAIVNKPRSSVNLNTFKNITDSIYKQLIEARNKLK